MFDTDLTRDYEAGLVGGLCDDDACDRLRRIGEEHDWRPLP
jgi:hypothetical protein